MLSHGRIGLRGDHSDKFAVQQAVAATTLIGSSASAQIAPLPFSVSVTTAKLRLARMPEAVTYGGAQAGGVAQTASYGWRSDSLPTCAKTSSVTSYAAGVISTWGVQQPSF